MGVGAPSSNVGPPASPARAAFTGIFSTITPLCQPSGVERTRYMLRRILLGGALAASTAFAVSPALAQSSFSISIRSGYPAYGYAGYGYSNYGYSGYGYSPYSYGYSYPSSSYAYPQYRYSYPAYSYGYSPYGYSYPTSGYAPYGYGSYNYGYGQQSYYHSYRWNHRDGDDDDGDE